MSVFYFLAEYHRPHCLAQASQLQEHDVPEYLYPSLHVETGLLPPVLHWGWIVDHGKMYQVIEQEWPHLARRMPYPDPFFVQPKPSAGDDEEDKEEEEDEEGGEWETDPSKYEHRNYADTLFGHSASLALRRKFGVPEDRLDLLKIKGFHDDQGVYRTGIAIGTNYCGVLNETTETEIRKLFDIQGEARWYLDCQRWYWAWHPYRKGTKWSGSASKVQSCCYGGRVMLVSFVLAFVFFMSVHGVYYKAAVVNIIYHLGDILGQVRLRCWP